MVQQLHLVSEKCHSFPEKSNRPSSLLWFRTVIFKNFTPLIYQIRTSEKSFISVFFMADSAIQFLSTYLGFISVRFFFTQSSQYLPVSLKFQHHHIFNSEFIMTHDINVKYLIDLLAYFSSCFDDPKRYHFVV